MDFPQKELVLVRDGWIQSIEICFHVDDWPTFGLPDAKVNVRNVEFWSANMSLISQITVNG